MLPLALTAASAAVSVAGSVASYFGRQKQARQMRAETDEQIRRMKLEQGRKLGEAVAAGGASGITMDSGSLTNYLSQMTAEMRAEAEWAKKAGYAQAQNVSTAAKLGLFTDIGGAMSQFGEANNWWKT